MNSRSTLAKHVVKKVRETDRHEVVIPFDFSGDRENELLMFIKPEVFMDAEDDIQAKAVEMILDKLDHFDARVQGSVVMSGSVLDENEIMNRHYGYINQMSRKASEMVSDVDKGMIKDKLGLESVDDYEVLGGHELLEVFKDLDSLALDRWWFEGSSTKIRSGFYVRPTEREGRKVVMVNAFHPEQLAHFTRPDRRIVIFLVQSDRPWEELRNDLIGETFPEKAHPDSIRGTLYRSPHEFGFSEVSIANNAVHLSAGPVEALFEIDNFLGKTLDIDIRNQHPRLVRRLLSEGLTMDQVMEVLSNPMVRSDGKDIDLHSLTEHRNTTDAVKIWVDHTATLA